MFDDIVPRYDLLNDLLSMGFDRWWRRRTAQAVGLPAGPVLDLGCGTGRLGERLARRSTVIGVDLSHAMLLAARHRARPAIHLVEGSAFRLPFADATFGGAVSGFVLRNLDDLSSAFAELARVLRGGAVAALVDITQPRPRALRRAFDAYFRVAAPALGSLAGKREAYRYLVESLAQLPPPSEVCACLESAGFRSGRARTLAPGMVTLWTATRAAGPGDSGVRSRPGELAI
jgi:demethylmenaquinone methyltransferase/2-methoxy-6-polyprenyl-1,4-benzoquinol methylase